MDYFKISKYQSKYENPIYLSPIIYRLTTKPITLDQLCLKLEKNLKLSLSPELESTIFLSICFMYSVNMIENKDGNLVRK